MLFVKDVCQASTGSRLGDVNTRLFVPYPDTTESKSKTMQCQSCLSLTLHELSRSNRKDCCMPKIVRVREKKLQCQKPLLANPIFFNVMLKKVEKNSDQESFREAFFHARLENYHCRLSNLCTFLRKFDSGR